MKPDRLKEIDTRMQEELRMRLSIVLVDTMEKMEKYRKTVT